MSSFTENLSTCCILTQILNVEGELALGYPLNSFYMVVQVDTAVFQGLVP